MGRLIVYIFKAFGFDFIVSKARGIFTIKIHKYAQHIDAFVTIQSLLKYTQPKVVYDIGANNGDWSKTLISCADYVQSVIFFEPQQKFVDKLNVINLGKTSKKIFKAGLGNLNEVRSIIGGTASASFLDVKSDYAFAAELNSEEEENAEIFRLDDLIKNHGLPQPDTIKIDVQGFELEVLKGGVNTFKNTSYVILELSFDKFYEGQYSTSELFKMMEDLGFIMIDTGFEWRKDYKINNRLLQIDGIFENLNLIKRN